MMNQPPPDSPPPATPASQPPTPPDWDERYREGNTPWDTGLPSSELVAVLDSGVVRVGAAIELGCGTGTNSIYLATRGFAVTAFDFSPRALAAAEEKARRAGVQVRFLQADVTQIPPDAGPCDFVFDRGCYHCVRHIDVAPYVAMVSRLLRPGARMLLLTGNAAETREHGPPGVTEQEIRDELGRQFHVEWLRPFRFDNPPGAEGEGPLGWSCLLMRRQ